MARQVQVALHSDAEAVTLTMRKDDVRSPAQAGDQPGPHDLLGMRERCQIPAGPFEISDAPGGCIGATVGLPLAAELPDHCRVRADHGHPSALACSTDTALRGMQAIQ